MTDTGDARYQTCKVCGAKDCDCTMGDWVTKLQAENAALKEQVAEQAREIATLIELLRLRGNIGNPAYEQQVTDTIKGII